MLNDMFSSVNMLQKGLKVSWIRNEVISNNIANIDTPKFKASHVNFEDLMAEAVGTEGDLPLAVTDDRHIPGPTVEAMLRVEPEIIRDETTTTRLDGNNVNIDNEMVELAKNSIDYYATVSKINSEFNKLNSAINVT